MKAAIPVVFAVVISAMLIVGGRIVLGEMKDVSGTAHDIASPGVSPCVYCHLPRDADEELLWAGEPNAAGPFSTLKNLCFSCHDGTVTPVGAYVFGSDRPEHASSPGARGEDCDRCHDPHVGGSDEFLRVPGNADFCQSCHEFAGPGDHPTDVNARALGVEPADSTWDPDHGDFSGTRLWNEQGTAPGDFVKCLTCHSPHGGVPGTEINSMAFKSSHDAFLPLCQNCHYGWGEE